MNLLNKLIAKTVQIALEKGIIKSKAIIVDATHTKSRYNKKIPRQALQETEHFKEKMKERYKIEAKNSQCLPFVLGGFC